MKNIILLFSFVPMVSLAQMPINGFSLHANKLIYQSVFNTNLSTSELRDLIKGSLKIDIKNITPNEISGYIKNIDANIIARKNGITWDKIPYYIHQYYLSGSVHIQIKEGKYRVTISDMELKRKYSTTTAGGRSRQKGATEPLEQASLNFYMDAMSKKFVSTGSAIYDQTFKEVFDFDKSKILLDQEF